MQIMVDSTRTRVASLQWPIAVPPRHLALCRKRAKGKSVVHCMRVTACLVIRAEESENILLWSTSVNEHQVS